MNRNLENLTKCEFESIAEQLNAELASIGLEANAFKIQWYNRMVANKFQLDFDDRCLAFVVISTPDMFEKAFIPFLTTNQWLDSNSSTDPIDECMKYHFNRLKAKFREFGPKVIHDFELVMPYRRPKVLVQTAAHVSGAAYYYKPDSMGSEDQCRGLLGVCIHPVFGGWFAIRAVIVLENLTSESLIQRQPKDVIPTPELKKKLLTKFNLEWMDWQYRDIIPVTKKYSALQIKYFSLKPSERKPFLKQLIELKN